MNKDELSALTKHVDALDLECDGASRIVHLTLLRAGIIHQVMAGKVKNYRGVVQIPRHWWIRVGRLLIDYRCRMWTSSDAPHGVFSPDDYPDFVYVGKPTRFTIDSCLALERIVSLRMEAP